MWIEFDELHAKLTRATDDERFWVREYLSFPDASARFKRGATDGKVHMFNSFNETFPAGFVSMVLKAGREEGLTVELIDKRVVPEQLDATADLAWLRDYQRAALDAALKRKRGILWLPTGAGKTELLVGAVRSVPMEWLFLVHRTTLGEQAAERFSRRNAEHGVDLGEPGVIGEGRWNEGRYLTCATFQTLAAGLKNGNPQAEALLRRVGGLVVDECHVLPAESFWKVAMTCGAYYRLGLSGTPLARGDRRSVLAIAALGPVIFRLKSDPLVAAGVLARPKIRMATLVQSKSCAPSWQGVYGEKVARSAPRNAKLVELVQRATKPALVFVKEIAHGRALTKRLLAAGVRADFTFGNHSTDWRRSMVDRLVRADLDALVCSVVFQEGVDIPALRSVIIGSGGKSVIAALQRIGRGMRVEKDKTDFEVYDILDRGNSWLETHSNARKHCYIAEGYETIIEPPTP